MAMQQAFQRNGLPAPEAGVVNGIIGLSLSEAVQRLLPNSKDGELHENIMGEYRDCYRVAEKQIMLYPDVHDVLGELKKRGYWLGVVTGKSYSGLMRVLDMFSLRDMFYVIRTADCTHSKPHPAMVTESMQELGVAANRTWVVGDALFDVQMAKGADVPCIGVSFGVGESELLLEAGASSVVDDFRALLEQFPPLK